MGFPARRNRWAGFDRCGRRGRGGLQAGSSAGPPCAPVPVLFCAPFVGFYLSSAGPLVAPPILFLTLLSFSFICRRACCHFCLRFGCYKTHVEARAEGGRQAARREQSGILGIQYNRRENLDVSYLNIVIVAGAKRNNKKMLGV